MKQKVAMGGSGPFAKCMWVESPEPTEADIEDGGPVEQKAIQLPLTEIAMAQHCTELVMDMELIKFGVAEEEMPLPQMAGEAIEETKVISTQESVIREAWHGWEDSLRMAHRMWWVTGAALRDRSRGEPSVHVTRLMEKEEENLGKWRD